MEKTHIKKFAIVIVCIFLFSGCDDKNNMVKNSEKISKGSGECGQDLSYGMIMGDPDKFEGCNIQWNAQIFLPPEKDESGIYFQAYANPIDSEENFIAGYDNVAIDLKEDDYILISGIFEKISEGENAFGAELRLPMIRVESIEKISRNDAVAPTVKERIINQTISQNNFDVTLDKIEYADEETRFYLTLKNNGNDSVNFYTYDSKVVQNEKQFESESLFDNDEELQNEILSGVTDSGILIFPAVDSSSSFTLYLDEPYGDDYTEKWEMVKFDVNHE